MKCFLEMSFLENDFINLKDIKPKKLNKTNLGNWSGIEIYKCLFFVFIYNRNEMSEKKIKWSVY